MLCWIVVTQAPEVHAAPAASRPPGELGARTHELTCPSPLPSLSGGGFGTARIDAPMRRHARIASGTWAGGGPAGRVGARVIARPDGSLRPLWFYFRAEEVDGAEPCFELANADDCLCPRRGWHTARPVYRWLPSPAAGPA